MSTGAYLGNPHDSPIWEELSDELDRAIKKFAPMHGPHEGYAVILEELDELWDEVKANRGAAKGGRDEAIQVAAMAIRYVLDVCDARETT